MPSKTKKKDTDGRVQALSVYLLKPTVKNFKDALTDKRLKPVDLQPNIGFEAELYHKKAKERVPTWVPLLDQGTREPLNIRNKSNSAVLFIRTGAKAPACAITFGFGRTLLDSSCYEMDFGLRVVVNIVNPDSMRSVDAATMEDALLQTRRQASRVSALEVFETDPDKDVLRAVVGTPLDKVSDGSHPELGSTIAGGVALACKPKTTFRKLGSLCAKLQKYYKLEDYKKNGFEWIDHLKPVKDVTLLESLDKLLIEELRKGPDCSFELAPPEIIDWEALPNFQYGKLKKPIPELSWEEYQKSDPQIKALSDAQLRNSRVRMVDPADDSNVLKSWPFYRTIVGNLDHAGMQYVISNGLWFAVNKDFATTVANAIELIPEAKINLRSYSQKTDKSEGDYTNKVCSNCDTFVLMDRKTIKPTNGRTAIEVCDLFTSDKQLVHIKPYSGSSTLSHLYSQGTVSAEVLQRDQGFRKLAAAEIAKTRPKLAAYLPVDPQKFRTIDFEIVYAIIKKPGGKSKWQCTLPFFSQLNLKHASEFLRARGYKVALRLIEK